MNLGFDDIRGDLGSAHNPLRIAIVGSGPSGFYAAEALLNTPLRVQVDMLERLPVPFGLVRYGVAPDHPRLKLPSLVFDKIAQSSGFGFLGNVAVGRDLSLDDLRATHHVILFACGAEADRRMGLANEDLPGSHTATEFVGWYNGHPEYQDRVFDLGTETAVIIGQGNVAIDIARILCKPVDALRQTDMADHALEALARSRVREVHLVGRRGPAQASFTTKELRELGELPDCATCVTASELELKPACKTELDSKANFNAAKNLETLLGWAGSPTAAVGKRIKLSFLRSPVALIGAARLQGVTLERNVLAGPPFAQQARGAQETVDIPCGLLFRSIGYRGRPLPGVPFDPTKGVFPNHAGRIVDAPGIYAAGWIKRGPSGIIGTNRADAVATVESILKDVGCPDAAGLDPRPKEGGSGLLASLRSRGTQVVSYDGWRQIDAEELRRGAAVGRPRLKITRIEEMLEVAGRGAK